MKRKTLTWALIVLALCAFLLSFSKIFSSADHYIGDLLYQKGNVASGKIVIIEIDEKSLQQLGSNPLEWDRKVFADLLEKLNKEKRPAVIGLDVIFAHEEDKESDEALIKAASADNVVTAGMYYYGNRLETKSDGSYHWETDAVIDAALPYEELAAVSDTGIVNLVADTDGKIRHILLTYKGFSEKEASFALRIAQKYCEYTGKQLVLPKNDHAYLDFTYKAGGYREKISFVDVLNGQYPASYFEDKIVLVGACASAMQDEYLTAISHNSAMYGVEVHANSIEMLLRGEYKYEVSDTAQRIVLLIALTIGVLVFSKADFSKMLICYIAMSVGYFLLCILADRFGQLLHPLWILSGITLLFIAGIAGRFVEETIRRRKLRERFERYVDPIVLKKILDNGEEGLELEGKETGITVLFVDICGFTSLSEKMDPKSVVAILNRYLEMVTACIMENGGTLDKFIGDCAMAFWNAPFEQEAPADKAVQAALQMCEGAKKLNEDLGFDLGFAIGIHTGKAIVGNIGSSKRLDFTAIGDTVNTASRLESLKIPGLTREGNIYISQELKDELKGEYDYEDLGDHSLKGKERPIRIYSVSKK